MATLIQSQHWLSSGSELWIISEKTPRSYLIKLNFLLNFQMGNALRKKEFQIPAKMNWWLSQTQIASPYTKVGEPRNFTIGCHQYLPCRWLSMIHCDLHDHGNDYVSDGGSYTHEEVTKKWCENIFGMWKNLKYPTLRIFAPEEIEFRRFESQWQKLDVIADFTFLNLPKGQT